METDYSIEPQKTTRWSRWPSLMNVAIESCFAITKELFGILTLPSPGEQDREQTIERIDILIDKREGLLKDIQPPFSEEEKKLGQQVVKMNKVIDQKLSLLREEVKRDMNGINKKKTNVKKYSNPYENMQSSDGVYYDKRK
jgi:flagellar protein FliT